MATVETPEDDDPAFLDAAFLGVVHTRASTVWMSLVKLGGKEAQFKLDTGAEVTAISDSTYQTLQGVKLKPATKPLYGPASQSLKVFGQFSGELARKQHSYQEQICHQRAEKQPTRSRNNRKTPPSHEKGSGVY